MSYSGVKTPRVVHEGQRSAGSVPHTSAIVLVALLFAAFVVGGAGTYAVLRYRTPHAQAAAPVGSARVTSAIVEGAGAKTAEPVTVAVDALPAPSVAPTMTLVRFPRSAIGHRVWIDDALVGGDDRPLKTKCGRRTIKIGSQGKRRTLDLPCGRELAL